MSTPLVVMPAGAAARALESRIPLREYADALEQLHLLAFPQAAEAALRLAVSRPGAVRALVLVATAPPADPRLLEQLAESHVPLLVLLGTRDPEVAPATGRQWHARYPHVHVVFVYDAGHDVAADRPEAFADVVLEFIEDPTAFLINHRDGAVQYLARSVATSA